MTRKKGYIFVQVILLVLCVLCALFILINERILARYVRRNYELPFLGATALLYLDEYRTTGEVHSLRSFEETKKVQVYYVTTAGEVLYPDSLSANEKQLLDHARARIMIQGYGQVYEQDGTNGYTIWGIFDRTNDCFAFVIPTYTGLWHVPHTETRGPAVFFSLLFCSFVVVVFVLVRRIFRGLDRTVEKSRDRMVRIQAVLDAQTRLLGTAQKLMNRCGIQLREQDPNAMMAEELLRRSHYLENSRRILHDSLLAKDEKNLQDRISVYALCTRVQSMIADELAEAGIVIRLNEVRPEVYVLGQESLLLMALEDLFIRLIPALPGGGVIGAVISGTASSGCLDITVPVGEKSFQPAGIFLSVFLFELMGIRLKYQSNENSDLVIHAEFQDSGL